MTKPVHVLNILSLSGKELPLIAAQTQQHSVQGGTVNMQLQTCTYVCGSMCLCKKYATKSVSLGFDMRSLIVYNVIISLTLYIYVMCVEV